MNVLERNNYNTIGKLVSDDGKSASLKRDNYLVQTL